MSASLGRYEPLEGSNGATSKSDNPIEFTPPRKRRSSFWLLLCVMISSIIIVLGAIAFVGFKGSSHSSVVKVCSDLSTRHEWRSLSQDEKRNYLLSVKCLKSKPSRLGFQNQSLYDDFPYLHSRQGEQTHYTAAFLSWHRWFIHLYEDALRNECDYNGYLPYWDWSLDWNNISGSPVWDNEFGFGGNGNSSEDGFRGNCVTDGPFAWLEVLFIGDISVPHCLSRGFLEGDELNKWTSQWQPSVIDGVLSTQTYANFSLRLEDGPHLSLPHIIHGDYSVGSAPADPIFFLQHAQIDRLWWRWQQTDKTSRLKDYSGLGTDSNSQATLQDILDVDGLGPSMRVVDVIDTTGGNLCYQY
ncbi:putative tyrosinase [Viridothelium virens]|uniref:Putative tyrosinase n=1 Tax=Viridothelium virens TaxID=1048519 RepID=A0A6A6HHK4_VIRVR|nr:putative tyrosinase [Viridothelium virens]